MNQRTRQVMALGFGLVLVAWQASIEPGRVFAVLLAVVAAWYAFAPVIRDGVTG